MKKIIDKIKNIKIICDPTLECDWMGENELNKIYNLCSKIDKKKINNCVKLELQQKDK